MQVDQKDKDAHLIKMRVAVSGERTIKDWENGLVSVKGFNKEGLLLPAYHVYESQGFCGTAGILNVGLFGFRSSSRIILTCCRNRYRIEKRTKSILVRRSYGI